MTITNIMITIITVMFVMTMVSWIGTMMMMTMMTMTMTMILMLEATVTAMTVIHYSKENQHDHIHFVGHGPEQSLNTPDDSIARQGTHGSGLCTEARHEW